MERYILSTGFIGYFLERILFMLLKNCNHLRLREDDKKKIGIDHFCNIYIFNI